MQANKNEFEQRMKAENSKLNRQKRYMKDAQMSNKGDWKSKNELNETKKVL